MIMHAFFKALLFLGSGSVIHGMHDDQDMRHYGRLYKLLPITATTFVIGWLAIVGVFPLDGFWSKDEILAHAWDHNIGLWDHRHRHRAVDRVLHVAPGLHDLLR
jgi:NADH:ubiquinone oxidoreductase subunit 5 (subunit L)/multisubunit Na+/H+ antiporter MnhA subunit